MDGYRAQSLVFSAQATVITLQPLSDLAGKRANHDRKKSLGRHPQCPRAFGVKYPTLDKASCVTAPPSSVAHLVRCIHRHGDGHANKE
ncbi:hypothetical protein PR002_g261 [Phytophthora rubi]|uniref:Uncharacterized protein n=1 Tax=Phytophthora rubi TaxID=129364 RepID=A0A6A3P7T0_9STRA|nr:hypothetical protein PR002_g261 [Phytophthora rubi]